MGRPSNKPRVLAAVLEVIERGGVAAVTVESVAAQAGMTVQGVLYHFASKDELMAATERAMWEEAEEISRNALVGDEALASIQDRREAYVRGYLDAEIRPGELMLDIDRALTGKSSDVAERFHTEWVQPDTATTAQLIALLAADGLRLNEVLGRATPNRAELVEAIVALLRDDASGAAAS